jgi:hypothetical protein
VDALQFRGMAERATVATFRSRRAGPADAPLPPGAGSVRIADCRSVSPRAVGPTPTVYHGDVYVAGRAIQHLSGCDLRKLSNYRGHRYCLRAIVSSPCPIDLMTLLNAL